MTKENKAGLVAAGAFLALVAAVVVLKTRDQGKPADPAPGDQVAKLADADAPAPNKQTAPKETEPPLTAVPSRTTPASPTNQENSSPVSLTGFAPPASSFGPPTNNDKNGETVKVPPPRTENAPSAPPGTLPPIGNGHGDDERLVVMPQDDRNTPKLPKESNPGRMNNTGETGGQENVIPVSAIEPVPPPDPPSLPKDAKPAPSSVNDGKSLVVPDKKPETSALTPPPPSATSPAPSMPAVAPLAMGNDRSLVVPPPSNDPPGGPSAPPPPSNDPPGGPSVPPPPPPETVTPPSPVMPKETNPPAAVKPQESNPPVGPAPLLVNNPTLPVTVTPPPPSVTDPAPSMPATVPPPSRSDNSPPSRVETPLPAVKPEPPVMEKSSFPQARPTPDQSEFKADDRSGAGTMRPIAGTSQPGSVVPAGHNATTTPSANDAKWKSSESKDTSSAGEKPLPRTTPVSVGNSAFRQTSAAQPAKAPERKRYDVTIYKVMDGDTWEKISKLHYLDERCGAALRAYNQAHARTSERMQREGTVIPGEVVVVPPLKELMDNHGPLISRKELKPENTASTSFAPPPSAPNNLPPTVSGNNNPPTSSSPPAGSGSSTPATVPPPGSIAPPPPNNGPGVPAPPPPSLPGT